MTAPNQEHLKVLEQTRQRLIQLTHSLGSLIASLNQSDPLPSWSSLQSQANIISNNLLTTSSLLREYQPLLSSLVAYPSPTYPGKTQANILEQLLRTKLDPRVEDWVSRGRAVASAQHQQQQPQYEYEYGNFEPGGTSGLEVGLTEAELDKLWSWAPIEANQEARKRNWGGDYTLEEKELGVENVVTGLRRELVVDDFEDDEDEDVEEEGEGEEDEMEVVPGAGGQGGVAGPATAAGAAAGNVGVPELGLDQVLRFMTTGAVPAAAISSGQGR